MSLTAIPTSQGAFAESPLVSNESTQPTLSIEVATDGTPGIVQPDGVTITIDPDGVISAVPTTGGVTDVTGTAPIQSTGGDTPDISVDVATVADAGVVRPDGETILIDGAGTIRTNPTGGGQQLNVGGLVLTGARAFTLRGSLLPIGTTDLVASGGITVVPVGKRWALLSVQAMNTGGAGAVDFAIQLKSSGVYYRLQTNTNVSAGASSTSNTAISIILNAGEGAAALIATTANQLNINVGVIEFDASIRLFSPRKLGVTTGANTIYTVPPGFAATMLSNTRGQTNCDMRFTADTSSRTVQVHNVPAGGSVGAATQIGVSTAAANSTNTIAMGCGGEPGDFVNLSVSVGAASQIAWLNAVAEIEL